MISAVGEFEKQSSRHPTNGKRAMGNSLGNLQWSNTTTGLISKRYFVVLMPSLAPVFACNATSALCETISTPVADREVPRLGHFDTGCERRDTAFVAHTRAAHPIRKRFPGPVLSMPQQRPADAGP